MQKVSEDPPCSRVPVEMFYQDKVWVNARGVAEPIGKIADGHLDNIIKWVKAHASHWHTENGAQYGVYSSPLMKALEREQTRRIPKRAKTPRAAIKDTLLNDVRVAFPDVRATLLFDRAIDRFIAGLRKRGYDVTKIVPKSVTKK